MFTGIVEKVGVVKSVKRGQKSFSLTFGLPEIFDDVKIGDSIAINGVCLTVNSMESGTWTADVMPETVRNTGLYEVKAGSEVNMERAMAANGRFGGHIVSGHIDGMGKIVKIKKDDIAYRYEITAGDDVMRYIVRKGSITIDGISLTVADIGTNSFEVSVIPHTLDVTVLKNKKQGDTVNLETDIVGRYIEKLFVDEDQNLLYMNREIFSKKQVKSQMGKRDISRDFLSENGYI